MVWETMAFGERPYWDWSNFEVNHKTDIYSLNLQAFLKFYEEGLKVPFRRISNRGIKVK